jgi:hypothetical protein
MKNTSHHNHRKDQMEWEVAEEDKEEIEVEAFKEAME